jgi:uncharacterized protein YjcR
MAELTRQQQKDYAKQLFLNEPGITQAEIAERVGVSKNTVCKWVNDGKWEEFKTSLLVEKDTQLAQLYRQLKQINDIVEGRDEGKRYPLPNEADTISKITKAIKSLETETNTAEKIATGKEFLSFIRKTTDLETSKLVARLFNDYLKSCING